MKLVTYFEPGATTTALVNEKQFKNIQHDKAKIILLVKHLTVKEAKEILMEMQSK